MNRVCSGVRTIGLQRCLRTSLRDYAVPALDCRLPALCQRPASPCDVACSTRWRSASRPSRAVMASSTEVPCALKECVETGLPRSSVPLATLLPRRPCLLRQPPRYRRALPAETVAPLLAPTLRVEIAPRYRLTLPAETTYRDRPCLRLHAGPVVVGRNRRQGRWAFRARLIALASRVDSPGDGK